MTLKIGDKKLDFYNEVAVQLNYDSVASVFSFAFYFDPENADHRAMFKPGRYAPVTVEHEGELLITGILLSTGFESAGDPPRSWVRVSGYSKTGVLEDCEIPTSAYPLQSNGLSLEQIAGKITKDFGLKVVVDSSVQSKALQKYSVSTASDSQSCKSYLAELAGQKHVMLSHTAQGELLLTEANINAAPVADFSRGMQDVRMSLDFDGQRMHSEIEMIKQQTKGRKDGTHKQGNSGQSSVTNPYVPVYRPKVNRQTSREVVDTANAARNILSDELKGLTVKIDMVGWTLGGKLAKPNTIITAMNPEVFLFKKTRLFVASVDFRGNEQSETATLTCFVPEVFGSAQPKNIFE